MSPSIPKPTVEIPQPIGNNWTQTTSIAAAPPELAETETQPRKKKLSTIGEREPEPPQETAKPKPYLVYFPATMKSRLEAAELITRPYEAHTSQQTFILDAIERRLEEIENEYNNGKPFPPINKKPKRT